MKRTILAFSAFLITVSAFGLISCQTKSDAAPKTAQQQAEAQTVSINIPTAKCSSCAKHIKKAVTGVDGVTSATVDPDKHTAEVKFISTKTNIHAIELAIAKSGYTANSTVRDSAAYQALDDCCKE